MKNAAILSALILGLAGALAAAPVSAETVSGIVVYGGSSPSSGYPYVEGGVNTSGGGGWNTLNITGQNFPPGISLAPGANDFTYEFGGTLNGINYLDIDLFLDGNASPGISASLGPLSGTPILTPLGGDTYALDGATEIPSADNLSSGSGSTMVTLTKFTFDGSPGDYSGEIDLWVGNSSSAVPEPSSFLLLSSGLAGFAGMIRRKLKAQV
jgi:hypothetical protein